MSDTPSTGNVDASGFDAYNGINKRAMKSAASSLQEGNWPSKEELESSMKKTAGFIGGGADMQSTSFQFLDPAYFDPLNNIG